MPAKIPESTIAIWCAKINECLAGLGITRQDIKTGRDAWAIVGQANILSAAYRADPTLTDAHIQTALEKIFPNAVFKDKKRY